MNYILVLAIGFWLGGAFVSSFTIKSSEINENGNEYDTVWYVKVLTAMLWPLILCLTEENE